MIIKQKSHKKKILVGLSILLAFIFAGGLAYLTFAMRDGSKPLNVFESLSGKNNTSSTKDSSEQDEPTPDQKLNPGNTDHSTASPVDESTGKQTVPMVASATVDGSIVYIRGGLNVFRSTGSCFAKLIGPNEEEVRKETTLLPNAGTTDCRTIQIPVSELSPGEWTFTLNYSADDAEGVSSASSFTI